MNADTVARITQLETEAAQLRAELDGVTRERDDINVGNITLHADIVKLRAENAALVASLIGAQKALRKALPFLPPDKELHFCGEWLDAINEELRKRDTFMLPRFAAHAAKGA